MIRSQTQATIERSPDEVWRYAADILRHGEWMTVTDPRTVRGGGDKTGDRGRERSKLGPFGWDIEFEVAEAEPGRRIVWRSVSGAPFQLEVSLDLVPVGNTSTQATYEAALELRGLWRLLTPLIAMEAEAGPKRELGRLKAQVEQQPR